MIDTLLAKAKPQVAKHALVERLKDRYRSSLYDTAKHLCGYTDTNPRTHGAMVKALEADTRRKLVVMPRGTFKSSIGVVAYSIWLLIRNPNLRILIDSEKYENAKNTIREIKGILIRPSVTRIFGDFAGVHGWNEGEITVAQRTKLAKEASITASGIGAGKTGQHYDVILMDDLNTEENSQNAEQRAKVTRHYRMNAAILEPDGVMVVIGTRYAVDDVIGHILNNEIEPEKGLLA